MTRYERVEAAINHQPTDHIPSCIHLADDGYAAYVNRLYDRYTDEHIRDLHKKGKLSQQHAIYYGMSNHVLPVGCPWWGWHDLPRRLL